MPGYELMCELRRGAFVVVYRARSRAANAPRALLVGPAADTRKALRASPFTIQSEFRVLGFISTEGRPPTDALGGVGDLVETMAALDVDTVIFAGHIALREHRITAGRADRGFYPAAGFGLHIGDGNPRPLGREEANCRLTDP